MYIFLLTVKYGRTKTNSTRSQVVNHCMISHHILRGPPRKIRIYWGTSLKYHPNFTKPETRKKGSVSDCAITFFFNQASTTSLISRTSYESLWSGQVYNLIFFFFLEYNILILICLFCSKLLLFFGFNCYGSSVVYWVTLFEDLVIFLDTLSAFIRHVYVYAVANGFKKLWSLIIWSIS